MKTEKEMIALFMNGTRGTEENCSSDLWYFGDLDRPVKYLDYDTNWKMIMEVLDKIESLEGCDYQMHTGWSDVRNKSGLSVCIMRAPFMERIIMFDPSRINALYRAVVEFVKRYNTANGIS